MQTVIFDLFLCGLVYGLLRAVLFIRENNRRRNNGTDDDDEGGLPVSLPPDIDLPPGVCLPDDSPRKTKEPEEVFA